MKPETDKIVVETQIKGSLDKVWKLWTQAEHIVNWNFASNDWCCPSAINDIIPGGAFDWRMEAKDGSMGFNFSGKYNQVLVNKLISYDLTDGRAVEILFSQTDDAVHLSESFVAEGTNSDEQQRAGWQAILENFKNYVESID